MAGNGKVALDLCREEGVGAPGRVGRTAIELSQKVTRNRAEAQIAGANHTEDQKFEIGGREKQDASTDCHSLIVKDRLIRKISFPLLVMSQNRSQELKLQTRKENKIAK